MKQYPIRLNAAWTTIATLSKYDRVEEFSDALRTARVHVDPSKGNEATDNHKSVRRLPKPMMCSFRVNAARTHITSIQKFTNTAAQTGPIRDQITVS